MEARSQLRHRPTLFRNVTNDVSEHRKLQEQKANNQFSPSFPVASNSSRIWEQIEGTLSEPHVELAEEFPLHPLLAHSPSMRFLASCQTRVDGCAGGCRIGGSGCAGNAQFAVIIVVIVAGRPTRR